MAFCPGCGYEFREGVRRCPDCDLDLVANLEQADDASARRLRGGKTVSVFASERQMVEMLAELLKQEGVVSLVKTADAPAPVGPTASFAELHLLEQDAQANGELIQELIAELGPQSSAEPPPAT
jgi:hypothetical protein